MAGNAVLSEHSGTVKRASRSAQENAYTSSTWWYDVRGFGILTFAYRDTLGSQIRFFERNIKSSHLEVAIGTGTLFSMILRRHKKHSDERPEKIVGIDYSPEMLEGSKRKFKGETGVALLLQDVTRLSFADATFDSINVANALHCFGDVDAAMSEISRVLKPGGVVALNALLHPRGFAPSRWIANSINRWGIRKGILHTPFSKEEVLAQFERCGLRVRENVTKGNCLFLLGQK